MRWALLVLLLAVPGKSETIKCDISVAGGSAASVAAALTAADADISAKVCLFEPTDWPGGQLSSSAVSAIDFGSLNWKSYNQPNTFRNLTEHIQGNPGGCWVSRKCFMPNWLVSTWIKPQLAARPNLQVFLRSVVRATQRASDGRIASLQVVSRTPLNPAQEWVAPLSQHLADWYSPLPSKAFSKRTLEVISAVVIEATEFGDVLTTARAGWAQGVEFPQESDFTTTQCGQAMTITYFMRRLTSPTPQPPVPQGDAEGYPFGWQGAATSIPLIWSYRRALCASQNCSSQSMNPGDITQQNWGGGNDMNVAYLWLSRDQVEAQVESGWEGGVNVTALIMAEERAFASFHWYRNTSGAKGIVPPEELVMERDAVGTGTGLAKLPYLRDTRRAIGLNKFRLDYSALSGQIPAGEPDIPVVKGRGYRFADTVALSNYNDDTHGLSSCTLPSYISAHTTYPFYIPFRALTVDGAPNLLVAGKTMAQTFHANSATRLHPSEWTSGVAAGAAATLMLQRQWNTTMVHLHLSELLNVLNSSPIGQPLEWRE